MKRECSACSKPVIAVSDVLLSDCQCPNCGAVVGFHWSIALAFGSVIVPITLVSTVMVLMQMDIYAALLWAPFPIGAISYIKARYCPLVSKDNPRRLSAQRIQFEE